MRKNEEKNDFKPHYNSFNFFKNAKYQIALGCEISTLNWL